MAWNPERTIIPREKRRRVAYVCTCCGYDIFEGEEYYDLRMINSDYGVLCAQCIEDMHHYDAEKEV